MRKTIAFVLALVLLMCTFAVAESPEGYPEVKEGIDLGGKTIYILDYWSPSKVQPRSTEPTDEEQLTYDWQDWIMENYNVTVKQKSGGSYSELHKAMMEYVACPDLEYYKIYLIHSKYVMSVLNNGYCMGFDTTRVDWDNPVFNKAADEFMTIGDTHYTIMQSSSPRQVLFFNKRLLEEAGIDWEIIYDMQAEGTWTWAAFEEMLAKLTQDTDGDGIIDVYGLGGDFRGACRLAPYLNGGKYFDFDENGLMQCYGGSDEVLESLNWMAKLRDNYFFRIPSGAGEATYDQVPFFMAGKYAFFMGESYQGFNDDADLLEMEDEWGCVAWPLNHGGKDFKTMYQDNFAVLANCYTEEEASMVSYVYSLWLTPAPGIDAETAWIGTKYNNTDERAVDETYAMLRNSEHGVFEKALYMNGQEEMIDDFVGWKLYNNVMTPAQCIEAALPRWQSAVDAYNENRK